MRTTIAIDDNLLVAAKEQARRRGVSLGQVLEDALRIALARDTGGERPVVPVFRGGTGVRPGIDLSSNRAILEVLDESSSLDTIR